MEWMLNSSVFHMYYVVYIYLESANLLIQTGIFISFNYSKFP